MKYLLPLIMIVLFVGCNEPIKVLQVPGKDQYCKIDVNGVSILPSGRHATPVGEFLLITHDPYGMAISQNGSNAVRVFSCDEAKQDQFRTDFEDDQIKY